MPPTKVRSLHGFIVVDESQTALKNMKNGTVDSFVKKVLRNGESGVSEEAADTRNLEPPKPQTLIPRPTSQTTEPQVPNRSPSSLPEPQRHFESWPLDQFKGFGVVILRGSRNSKLL